jgi:23S rRNA (cytosine1962-C5)-methyltransferase
MLGTGYLNPHSLICARLISRHEEEYLNRTLLVQRLNQALSLRNHLFEKPFYRLVYSESDGLPGLVVDRFGDVLVVQISTAGMECVRSDIVSALEEILKPRAIVFRNNSPIRNLEGLDNYIEVVSGTLPAAVLMEENGAQFQVPVLDGQKTGWYYDHRMNRARLSHYVKRQRVLDVFSYGGGWGIQAAVAGAQEVWCVDSSQKALQDVQQNAELNGVSEKVKTLQGDAFEVLKKLKEEQQKFDVVILDPPAFIKRKKDLKEGEQAYHRLNQKAMQVLNQKGFLISASCSLHLQRQTFANLIWTTSRRLNRHLQLLEQGYQSPDHPVHPVIPETDYLKTFIFYVIDDNN